MEKKFSNGFCEMTHDELRETDGGGIGWVVVIVLGLMCTMGGCSAAEAEDMAK